MRTAHMTFSCAGQKSFLWFLIVNPPNISVQSQAGAHISKWNFSTCFLCEGHSPLQKKVASLWPIKQPFSGIFHQLTVPYSHIDLKHLFYLDRDHDFNWYSWPVQVIWFIFHILITSTLFWVFQAFWHTWLMRLKKLTHEVEEHNQTVMYSALPDVYGQLHLIPNTQNISLKSWWVGKIIEHSFERMIITK
jgi:hypothetical protein